MRKWSLRAGDPLNLSLAADVRLSTPNYVDDHIWEMEFGGGEPSALSLRTTYGLRARSMRIFPRFTESGISIANVSEFVIPPVVRRCFPNFMEIEFSPFEGLEVTYEIRVPDSNSITGRIAVTNSTSEMRSPQLEMCAVLVPLDGHSLKHTQMQMVNVLVGQSGELVPLLFLTGGPLPGPGPQPSLVLDLDLSPGDTRQITWVQAADSDHQTSFDNARLIAAQPWDAECARIEMVNAGGAYEIYTSDPNWDAAFAFSQNAAYNLFFPANEHLPHPSFVQARGPDHGYSRKGDGSDYPAAWGGQSPLDTYFLSSIIPAAPNLVKGLLHNFLSSQHENGAVDDRPSLSGQRGNYQAMPILASLAWRLFENTNDDEFLKDVFQELLSFFWNWFSSSNDRDNDGIPEWAHLLQTCYEENPSFDTWNPWSQGANIAVMHNPALISLLYNEAQALVHMAEQLGENNGIGLVKKQANRLKTALDEAWNPRAALYRYRDRVTGNSTTGKILAQHKGSGTIKLNESFDPPIRLLIEVHAMDPGAKRPEILIREEATQSESEFFSGGQFLWRTGGLVATSQQLHKRIGHIKISGLESKEKVVVRRLDYTLEDHTLLLPLWAGIPNTQQAKVMLGRTIFNAARFERPFGIPACPTLKKQGAETACLSVYLTWNLLICEGLLTYGFRKEAAKLFVHLMSGIIQNLKENRAFYQRYHAENGQGIGERNAVSGLAPVGLFMKVLGVEIVTPTYVRLEGTNPFPWPVRIQYKGLKILRDLERSDIIFPNGKSVEVSDPVPCTISL